MVRSKLPIALLVACATMTAADAGWAHGGSRHRHSSVGIYFGSAAWPWYYPYRGPYPYYYPPVVAVPVAPPSPPVYIEQATEAPPDQSYWYYCNSAKAYYPYVQQCTEVWQKVTPYPPS